MQGLIVAEHLTRQLDLIPLEVLGQEITIVGAGAIGSWTTLALVKMGFEAVTVYDDDGVSIENMSCQFYRFSDIGNNKAKALHGLVKDFTGVFIMPMPMRYTKEMRPEGILIMAVDSMEARKEIWEGAKGFSGCKAVIDPRMGAEQALMYCVNPNDPDDVDMYESTLYSDTDAVQERCTAKATIYTANMLSGLVAKTVKDLVTNGPAPRVVQWSIKDNDFLAWRKDDGVRNETATIQSATV